MPDSSVEADAASMLPCCCSAGGTSCALLIGALTSPWKRHSLGSGSSMRPSPLCAKPHDSASLSMSRPVPHALPSEISDTLAC